MFLAAASSASCILMWYLRIKPANASNSARTFLLGVAAPTYGKTKRFRQPRAFRSFSRAAQRVG